MIIRSDSNNALSRKVSPTSINARPNLFPSAGHKPGGTDHANSPRSSRVRAPAPAGPSNARTPMPQFLS